MNNGVTNEDIINMSQLVVSFQNSNFLADVSSQGGNKPNNTGINDNTQSINKNETWKLLINKLKIIQNFDSEIEKLTFQRNELDLNINRRNAKKDEIDKLDLESDTYLEGG